MGIDCLSCGKRFYMPPGEQRWMEKRCKSSITQPRVPQYCVSCMERRFSQPVSKENRALSRDGRVRMPSGEREYEASYAQEPIEFKGERLKKPVVELSSDSAGIQFQRLKQGHTCFGRIR